MPQSAEPTVVMHVLDVIAARKLWHQRTLGVFRLVAQPSVLALDVVLDTPTRTLQQKNIHLLLSTSEGESAHVTLEHNDGAAPQIWSINHGRWPDTLCTALDRLSVAPHVLIPVAAAQTKQQIRLVHDAVGVHIATMTLSHGHINDESQVHEWSEVTIQCTFTAPVGTASIIAKLIEGSVACTIAKPSIRVALTQLGNNPRTHTTVEAMLNAQKTALRAIGRDPDEALLVPLPLADTATHRLMVAAALVQHTGHPGNADPYWMVLNEDQRLQVAALVRTSPVEISPLPSAPFDARRWPFPDILRIKLRGQFRRVLHRELAVKQGFSAEDIHRIRVSLRKLNSLIECGVSVYDDEEIAQYRRGFRRMSRFLGEVRDADAFAEHVKRILGTHTVPADIRQALHRVRQKALKELEALITADKHQLFLNGFATFVCTAEPHPAVAPTTAAYLQLHIETMMRTLIAPMQTPATKLDSETLHEIRIQAKKLRYTIEAFPDVLLPTALPLVQLLEKLQLRLGIIQDAATAHRMLIDTHLMSHAQAKTVLTALRSEANYQRTQLGALWTACTSNETQAVLHSINALLTHEGNHA